MGPPKNCVKCSGPVAPLFTSYYCTAGCDRLVKRGLLTMKEFLADFNFIGSYSVVDPKAIVAPSTRYDYYRYLSRIVYTVSAGGGIPSDTTLGGMPASMLVVVSAQSVVTAPVLGKETEDYLEAAPYFKKLITGSISQSSGNSAYHTIHFKSNLDLIVCNENVATTKATRGVGLAFYGTPGTPPYVKETISNNRKYLMGKSKDWNVLDWDVPWTVVV